MTSLHPPACGTKENLLELTLPNAGLILCSQASVRAVHEMQQDVHTMRTIIETMQAWLSSLRFCFLSHACSHT